MRSFSQHQDSNKVVLTVCFSGTGFEVDAPNFVASELAHYAINNEASEHITMGFHGCGVIYPLAGGIFGAGLHGQVRTVVEKVQELIRQGKKVTLNAYGHSRGAIAAELLAKAVGDIKPTQLTTNLALLDPVGGNLDPSVALDPADITLTDQVIDLSESKNLNRVLRLWPHKDPKLLALIAYRPVMSKLPAHCDVIEDVVLDAHAYAEMISDKTSGLMTLECVSRFLNACGSRFRSILAQRLPTDQEIVDYYNLRRPLIESTTGTPYSLLPIEIVARPHPAALYVNKHQEDAARRLAAAAGNKVPNVEDNKIPRYVLFVRPTPLLKRFLWSSLKFLVIGAGIATALYFTGGLAAIPYIAAIPIAAAAAKAASIILLPLYRVTLKPILRGIINLFSSLRRKCYPDDRGIILPITPLDTPSYHFKSTHAVIQRHGIPAAVSTHSPDLSLELAPLAPASPLFDSPLANPSGPEAKDQSATLPIAPASIQSI